MQAVADEAVRTAAGGSINAGIWTLVGVVVTTVGVVAVAYIKQWGPWKRIASEERADDFGRLRNDIDKQSARIEKLEQQVEAANNATRLATEAATKSDAKLQTVLTACELLLGLVEREMPDASEIKIVKRLLAQAATNDLGVGEGMRKIAMMRGVGE
jgi:uncharacterized protein YlxW (UPF0749 family)